MDSRVVNKLIRSEVWPILREQGFTKFNARNAWRYRPPLIDVVNFQSFNAYLAEGVGCTSYSFGLNLGVYLQGGHDTAIKRNKTGYLPPHQAECHSRVQLNKREPILSPMGERLVAERLRPEPYGLRTCSGSLSAFGPDWPKRVSPNAPIGWRTEFEAPGSRRSDGAR